MLTGATHPLGQRANREGRLLEMPADRGLAGLPLAPKNPLPYFQRLRAVRNYHDGPEPLRDAGGPVTRWGDDAQIDLDFDVATT